MLHVLKPDGGYVYRLYYPPVNNMASDVDAHTSVNLDNLYPAILQCFTIIIAGYLAGRTNLITSTQSKGLGNFVSHFSLPALVFKSMVELKFHQVNWTFLCSILLAKSVVFIFVGIFSLLLCKKHKLGKAGIYSIFATQSNDFALGYPIVQALYEEHHPDYLQYIYLVAPISLAILNPIGFTLLEFDKWSHTAERGSSIRVSLSLLKRVLFNPIIAMTIIGIFGNLIFHEEVPRILKDILEVLGDSYTATALFYLGLNMVGKISTQTGFGLITPCLLIVAKTLMLPLLTREIVSGLNAGGNASETLELSNYGFLYGTFPTAPSVFVYAAHFGVATGLIASGLVLCTFLSAPFMFVSAKMVTLTMTNETDYKYLVTDTMFDSGVLGIILGVWVLVVFALGRKWSAIPFSLTSCLLVSQILSSLGIVLWSVVDRCIPWQHYVQFIIFLIGVYGSRWWTAMLALGLCMLKCRSLCFLLRMRRWLYIFGCSLPILLTALILTISKTHTSHEVDPNFQYGNNQVILSAIVLALCSIITIVSLVVQHRCDVHQHLSTYRALRQDSSSDSEEDVYSRRNVLPDKPSINEENEKTAMLQGASKTETKYKPTKQLSDIEDLGSNKRNLQRHRFVSVGEEADEEVVLDEVTQATINEKTCLLGAGCSMAQKQKCRALISNYESLIHAEDPEGAKLQQHSQELDEYQTSKHVVLLLLLTLSMIIGLFLCMWRLFRDSTSGIYLELEFLDSVFNFCQSFFAFAIFGLDTDLIVVPLLKRWRKFWYGSEGVRLPPKSDLDDETTHTCEQFIVHHKDKCIQDLIADRRSEEKIYKSVFSGTDLVDWLIDLGLVHDRSEAVKYGRQLVEGRVIRHYANLHTFYDQPYFYKFVEPS